MTQIRKTMVTFFLLMSAGVAAAAAWLCYEGSVLRINGQLYSIQTQTLDLSNQVIEDPRSIARLTRLETLDLTGCYVSPDDYDYLSEALPACRILWQFPFQGNLYPLSTHTLQADHLSQQEVAELDHLRQLYHVNGWDCNDWEALYTLSLRRPECSVFYRVSLGNCVFACDDTEILLNNADPAILLERLRYLPNLTQVELQGVLPEAQAMLALENAYPQITFLCQTCAGQMALQRGLEMLDLSGKSLTDSEVRQLLTYYPDCKTVNLLDSTLSDFEVRSLAADYPGIFFLWNIELEEHSFPTDSEEIDLSYIRFDSADQLESFLSYFPNLTRVIVCDCGLDSDTLSALGDRHPDIRFVWEVSIGGLWLRTDAEYLMPGKYGATVYDGDLDNLRYCQDLICIDLGHMPISDTSFLQWLPELKYLVIADTEVSDISSITACRKLIYLEMFMTQVRDLTPLQALPALEDLNLSYTPGDPEPIAAMTWLKRLWWPGNWPARALLYDALPDTQKDFDQDSSTGGSWRTGKRYYEMRDILGMGYMIG